jgi:outer membrane receptor protein involved in Fe transport
MGQEVEPSRVSLRDYLVALNEQGTRIIFSSDLVSDDRVIDKPDVADDPVAGLRKALQTNGLDLADGPSGSYLVVRAAVEPPPRSVRTEAVKVPIPEIVVTSSLHRLQYAEPETHSYFARELAARVPTTGEEIVRLTNRLPGTASGGISSRNHVRGGEENEVLFLFDGLRLYEPYHLRDFQAVASIVNSGAIGSVDFFSGAYPASYGDRMSGVMIMEMREPGQDMETELALSFFNTSVASMGRFGLQQEGEWLVSARRGNLDLIADVIDPDVGSPDYSDYLAHAAWEFGPRAVISANVLVSDDKISLFDEARGEAATASYANRVGWLKWQADWSASLSSRTIIAASEIADRRRGTLELPGIVAGALDEQSDLQAVEIRQDWTWVLSDNWMWRFGANLKHLDADYRHVSEREISAPFAAVLGTPGQRSLDFDLVVDGAQYAAWSELRWRASERVVVDLGLRWDQQTYPIAADDRQYSPRASILLQPTARSEIRFGWGQFYQAQETNELQLSDGVGDFFPAQRAEHFVLNARRWFDNGVSLEVSLYRKSFRTLRPRFENVFNTLTLVPELQFDRIMIDPDKAESVGAEVTVKRGAGGDDLVWWASYGWSRTRDWIGERKVERSWDQTHAVKAGLVLTRGAWDLGAAAEIHTGWPATVLLGSPGVGLEITERNELRYATFASLDLRVSRAFPVRRGEFRAFLEVTNSLDRSNPCCTEYSVDGRGELQARTADWLPLVPSLGFVWRF